MIIMWIIVTIQPIADAPTPGDKTCFMTMVKLYINIVIVVEGP